MSYQIIQKEQVDETIYTTVVFTINDVVLEPIKIPHFMPQSTDDIIQGIVNRELSEKRRLDSIQLNAQLITEL